jgi:hypothetical protein
MLINFHKVDEPTDISALIARYKEVGRAIDQLLERARQQTDAGVRPPGFAYEYGIQQCPCLSKNLSDKNQTLKRKSKEGFCKNPYSGYFCRLLKRDHSTQRSGRVVDRGGLENRCTVRYRGFESLLLCKTKP